MKSKKKRKIYGRLIMLISTGGLAFIMGIAFAYYKLLDIGEANLFPKTFHHILMLIFVVNFGFFMFFVTRKTGVSKNRGG